VRISLVIRADVHDIAFHDEYGYVSVDFLENLRLQDDARMPGTAREGLVEYYAVDLVVLDILNETLNSGKDPFRARALSNQCV